MVAVAAPFLNCTRSLRISSFADPCELLAKIKKDIAAATKPIRSI
jgi:hypothetical protein